ncbi:MAG TPA: alpha/beta fold hydrolase [Candidatus Xenobia bacterium]|nr:alpha/beta fold hydrolase [Candidatus Xenobia bacterium]
MTKHKVQSLVLPGPVGRLEALWEQPPGARTNLVGLVCHPHPLYGGTMHNKVVHHTARALRELGLCVLRFNFRGAGASDGQHDNGRGETEDVRAALTWLGEKTPEAAIVLAGFSFGAWVGLRAGCEDERVRVLVGVGMPVNNSDFSYLAACRKPKLFIQGTQDQFGSLGSMERVFAGAAEPKELAWIEGADHFFSGHLEDLRHAIAENLPPLSGLGPARK